MMIRPAGVQDADAIWSILEPTIRAGETYALPSDWTRTDALDYWGASNHQVFVVEDDGALLGTYFIRPNRGAGIDVANCAYMTAVTAFGRGVASAMCAHSLRHAAAAGYRAMQFNFVVSTNTRAIALWRHFGFEVVDRLPEAFRHPVLGPVDALVMSRKL
jgi:ribosomal protein S18 acetylase RimI-like enzyme